MRLFIAEKPSLARAIAEVLPAPHQRQGDCIECGGGNTVAWCAGHILELAAPDQYAPQYKTWCLDDLPIVPTAWKLTASAPKLLQGLKALLRSATRVVHAGDPDREGQLLVDEVLHFLRYQGPTDRLLIRDLNPDAVRKALGAIEPNDRYRTLYEAALVRQRADWLYGMNLTRLYTVLGRAGGYDGVLSVGRVQTPVLGLVVRRDLAIEAFRPTPYFVLVATVVAAEGSFRAQWVPGAATHAGLDEEGRLVARDKADEVCARTAGQRGTITVYKQEKKAEPAPLPYALADVQMDASKRLGLSAAQGLEACQSLYEAKLVTYPRSDCAYLPEGHWVQARAVSEAIAKNAPALASLVAGMDASLRSRAWNDRKVTAHHALIPTPNGSGLAALSERERGVYALIARRYLMQFYRPFEFLHTRVELVVCGERFTATGRQVLAQGWKALTGAETREDDDRGDEDASSNASLPPLQQGDEVTAESVSVMEKETKPPKRFTEASLIEAMCHVGRFVEDAKIKQVLNDADGIGTPATRASILETLMARRFLERSKGKQIVSTATGRSLVDALPKAASVPDMTAAMEMAMRRVQEGQVRGDVVLDGIQRQLEVEVTRGKQLGSLSIAGAYRCTQPGCTGYLRQLKGPRGAFWSCGVCRTTVEDDRGKPLGTAGPNGGRSGAADASGVWPARGARGRGGGCGRNGRRGRPEETKR